MATIAQAHQLAMAKIIKNGSRDNFVPIKRPPHRRRGPPGPPQGTQAADDTGRRAVQMFDNVLEENDVEADPQERDRTWSQGGRQGHQQPRLFAGRRENPFKAQKHRMFCPSTLMAPMLKVANLQQGQPQ